MPLDFPDPIRPVASRSAVLATLLVLLAAAVAAAVRILPWVLDPSIPWATLLPFAKSLLAMAFEAAILTGWSVGWALATARLVERGEARVLASLGESPVQTVARLGPQGGIFVVILAVTSLALGREAAAPGRVVGALLEEGRAACVQEADRDPPPTHAVPFVGATWLCAPSGVRIVGRAPIGNVVFTAKNAHVSDDLRRIDLEDAQLSLPGASRTGPVARIHVGTLTLKGLAPFAQASAVPPSFRALIVSTSGVVAAAAVVLAILTLRRRKIGPVIAVAIGASGPLAALGTLRALEVRVPEVAPGLWLATFVLVPLAAIAAVVLTSAAVALLPVTEGAGTT
ncbi:MAG: hypothetical protein JST00_40490 [Deltaproteobacteria bacterium]|nr:hypothetical protein [Deltaproteobacteria bacterium]